MLLELFLQQSLDPRDVFSNTQIEIFGEFDLLKWNFSHTQVEILMLPKPRGYEERERNENCLKESHKLNDTQKKKQGGWNS